jgi:Flp pilus assembly protein TadD
MKMRRRLLTGGALLLGAAAAAGSAWYGWRWYAAPSPPAFALNDADPALQTAAAAATEAIKKDPYSPGAWAGLGKLLRAAGYHREAGACFAVAEKLEPNQPRWAYLCGEGLLQTDPETALAALGRAVALCDRTNADDVAPRLRLAEGLLARGRTAEAEGVLRRALELDPDNPAVQFNLGLAAAARDDFQAARDHLTHCRSSPLTRQRACARLAEVCRRLGDERAADDFDRQASAAPPDRHWPDPWLSDCFEKGVGTADHFRRAEQLEAQGRWKDAAALLQELVDRAPDYRANVGLGKDLAQTGELARAEQALREALRLEPNGVQAHYFLAKVVHARAERKRRDGGDGALLFEEAADHARQATIYKPDHGPAHQLLGQALEAAGRRADAIRAYRAAAACSPDSAESRLLLGEALAADGDTEGARKALEEAVRLAAPDDSRPRAALARLGPSK